MGRSAVFNQGAPVEGAGDSVLSPRTRLTTILLFGCAARLGTLIDIACKIDQDQCCRFLHLLGIPDGSGCRWVDASRDGHAILATAPTRGQAWALAVRTAGRVEQGGWTLLGTTPQIEDQLRQLGWVVQRRGQPLPDGTTGSIIQCRRGKHRIVSKGPGNGPGLREAYWLTCKLDGRA